MPNDSTTSQPQKIGILLFRRLFFNARGKIRYWLVGGLAGILYNVLCSIFPILSIDPIDFILFLAALVIMVPLNMILPLSGGPSTFPLVPSFSPLGSAVFGSVFFSLRTGLGVVIGFLIGKIPSRAWRYGVIFSLLIFWLGFAGVEYFSFFISKPPL